MPDIKESIQEVYAENKLSERARQSILTGKLVNEQENAVRPRFSWQPFAVSVGMVAVLFLLALTIPSDSNNSMVSTQLAPYDADDAVMARIEHFLEIVEDGVITDEERRYYLMTSDWALQLAIDSGTSIFYNRPNITEAQGNDMNTLLSRMYSFVLDSTPGDAITMFDEIPISFSQLIKDLPKWNKALEPFSGEVYVSSLKEKPVSKKEFFTLEWKWQALIVGFIILFLYLFIQNIRFERKKRFFIFHVLALGFLMTPFFEDSFYEVAYDETSILQIMNENASPHLDQANLELIDIAQYGDKRFGLAKAKNGGIMISCFEKQGGRYILRSTTADPNEGAKEVVLFENYSFEEVKVNAVGINDDTHLVEIELINDRTNETLRYPINPEMGKIYLLHFPTDSISVRREFKYEEGHEPQESE